MNIGKTLSINSSNEWRKWLSKNHGKEKDIWVIFYKKVTGKQTMSIRETVDEAICFGWIDSIQKGIDKEEFALRFSPRRPNSIWSKINIERVKKLIKEKKMTKVGLDKVNKNIIDES